jgi:hypothetical protein
MGSALKVFFVGNDSVKSEVLALTNKSGLPIEEVDFPDCEVFIDCGDYSFGKLISLIGSDKIGISGDKKLFYKFGVGIIERVLFCSSKMYLNALAASTEKTKFSFVNMTSSNYNQYDKEDWNSLPEVDEKTLAKFLYQDMVRVNHLLHPEYESQKQVERDKKAMAAKENIYAVAAKLDLEVEAQPCGIEPKLVENDEVQA